MFRWNLYRFLISRSKLSLGARKGVVSGRGVKVIQSSGEPLIEATKRGQLFVRVTDPSGESRARTWGGGARTHARTYSSRVYTYIRAWHIRVACYKIDSEARYDGRKKKSTKERKKKISVDYPDLVRETGRYSLAITRPDRSLCTNVYTAAEQHREISGTYLEIRRVSHVRVIVYL